MSETAEQTHALHPVLDALFARIRAEVPAERRDALEAFAKAFLRRLSDEELEHHGADLLFSMVSLGVRLRRSARERAVGGPRVRADGRR